MKNKIILIAVVILGVLACAFAAWKLQGSSASPSVDPTLLALLQTDLRGITPYFIGTSETGMQPLTPQEGAIKNDIVDIFASDEPDNREYFSRLLLRAIGTRYVLVSQPSADSYYDIIIDSQTGSTTIIPNGASYAPHYVPLERSQSQSEEGRQIALYIGYQDLYTYTLDQSSFVLVPGSKLTGSETYHSGTGDFRIYPEETHTDDSITISVFDSSEMVQNPDALSQPTAMQTMNKKLRDVTFSF